LLALKRSFPASDAFVDTLLGRAALFAVLYHACEASPRTVGTVGLMAHLPAPAKAGRYRMVGWPYFSCCAASSYRAWLLRGAASNALKDLAATLSCWRILI
jgi:hypothetical protein